MAARIVKAWMFPGIQSKRRRSARARRCWVLELLDRAEDGDCLDFEMLKMLSVRGPHDPAGSGA